MANEEDFWATRQEQEMQTELRGLPELRKHCCEFEETKVARVCRTEYGREENTREKKSQRSTKGSPREFNRVS